MICAGANSAFLEVSIPSHGLLTFKDALEATRVWTIATVLIEGIIALIVQGSSGFIEQGWPLGDNLSRQTTSAPIWEALIIVIRPEMTSSSTFLVLHTPIAASGIDPFPLALAAFTVATIATTYVAGGGEWVVDQLVVFIFLDVGWSVSCGTTRYQGDASRICLRIAAT